MAELWPFRANWRESYHVTFEFLTDIFTSRSGKEQRRALRTTPRRTLQYTMSVGYDDAKRLNRQMRAAHATEMLAADESRQVAVLPADSGATTLIVEAAQPWLVDGANVVIIYGDTLAALVVDTVTDNIATLTAPLAAAWPAGSKLCPALTGRLAETMSAKQATDSVIEASVNFSATPAVDPPIDPGNPAEVFNGREVFPLTVEFAGGIDGSFVQMRDAVDFNRGRITVYTPIAFDTRIRQVRVTFFDVAERTAVVQFFSRMKGRRGEFYMPSLEPDLIVAATAAAGDSSFTVAEQDDYDTVHRAIMIRWRGYQFYRTVSGVDGTTVSLDIPLPVTLQPGDTVSWLTAARFATDMLDVECVTDTIGRTQMAMQTLEDLQVASADDPWATLSEGARRLISLYGWNFAQNVILVPADDFVNVEYPWISDWTALLPAGRDFVFGFLSYTADRFVNTFYPGITEA